MSQSDVHSVLWSTDLEDVEVTLSSFNSKPNIPARVVFWDTNDGTISHENRPVLLSLSTEEMDALCVAWARRRGRIAA